MTEQPDQEQPTMWQFAPEYEARFKELPPSQRREALKRLTGRRRNPLTEEQCREVCPDVEQTLDAVHKAYLNKKQRSKQASAVKRMVDRAQPVPEVAPVEAVADAVAAISLAAAEVVAEAEPAPAPQPAPIGGSAPYNPQPRPGGAPVPQKSAPIAIPKKTVPPAAAEPAAAEPAKVPSTPAKKKGLAGRFA